MKSLHIFNRHVDFAVTCLDKHEKGKPFHPCLHRYFKENRQFGSRDRRTIKSLCYNWFRLGYCLNELSKREQVFLSYVVLEQELPEWILLGFERFILPPSWLEWDLNQRLGFIEKVLSWSKTVLFPELESVSSDVDKNALLNHQCEQPLVWVRCIHDNDREEVLKKMPEASVKDHHAIGVEAGNQLEAMGLTKRLEVQDYSSQKVYGDLTLNHVQHVWDCCCASGGKSLLLLDRSNAINVYGSDVRKSILSNFLTRTGRHRHRVWSALLDLSKPTSKLLFRSKQNEVTISQANFDLIIADVPCTGSGTWNRNPEFKQSFNGNTQMYSEVQQAIVSNAWPFLKRGGRLLYSTCSVYSSENEDIINQLQLPGMNVVRMGYHLGYNHQSDSMFFAEIENI